MNIVCCGCADIFGYSGDALLVCPQCGYRLRRESYQELIASARDAVTYGYSYRKKFEKYLIDSDMRKGEGIKTGPLAVDAVDKDDSWEVRQVSRTPLAMDNIIILLSLAAVCASVTTDSADVVKKICQRMAVKRRIAHATQTPIYPEEFTSYFSDYQKDHQDLELIELSIVLEGMIDHNATVPVLGFTQEMAPGDTAGSKPIVKAEFGLRRSFFKPARVFDQKAPSWLNNSAPA